MRYTQKQFIQLAKELTTLSISRKIEHRKRYTLGLDAYISTIEPLYRQKIIKHYNSHIKPFEDELYYLKTPSVLSLLSKHQRETHHSAILRYLFDCTRAKDALSVLVPDINLDDYEVRTEHTFKTDKKNHIKQGSIDILIWSEKHKWVIAIENKINACIRKLSATMTQIDNYGKYLDVNFANYTRHKIVLSYKDNSKDCREDWSFVDYKTLFNALSRTPYRDRVVEDYLTALFQLIIGEYKELTPEHLSLFSIREYHNLIIEPLIPTNNE